MKSSAPLLVVISVSNGKVEYYDHAALFLSSMAFLGFADNRVIILQSVNSASSSPCGGMVIGMHGTDKLVPSDG